MTDPRNVNDKAFITSSIRQLIQFLTEHNYPEMISPKILSRPSNRDFANISMFIFRTFDPNLQFNGKFEDDLVALFKLMGYPCNISKSNIAAAGTPHAWPSLLAALVWLIELKMYDEASRIGEIPEEDDSNDRDEERNAEREFHRYLRAAYPAFIIGDDKKVEDLEMNLVGKFDDKHQLLEDEIRSYEQRLLGVNREIENIELKRAQLPVLEQQLSDYQRDMDKFERLVNELQKHKEQLQSKCYTRETELEKLVLSIGTLNGEIQTLKDKIATQELSPEDVKRMQAEHQQLQQSLEAASEQRQANQRKVWELEMALRDRVQALDDCARQYNSIAEDLKLVPSTARNARGKHLAIEVDVRAKKRDDLLRTDVHKDILPTLQALKMELSANTSSLKSELQTEQEGNDEVEGGMAELEESLRLSESKLKRMEDALKREKEALDCALQSHMEEKESLEGQLDTIRDTSLEEGRYSNIARKIEKLKAERELHAQSHVDQKVELMNAIMDIVTACASHRETVQQGLSDVKDKFSYSLERLLHSQAAPQIPMASNMPPTAPSVSTRNNAFTTSMPVGASQFREGVPLNAFRGRSPSFVAAPVSGSRLGGSASRVRVNQENYPDNEAEVNTSWASEKDDADNRYEVPINFRDVHFVVGLISCNGCRACTPTMWNIASCPWI
jgi:kinetochore protein NDC80